MFPIVIDKTIEESKMWLEERIEKCGRLYNKTHSPTHRKCFDRSKQLLHQLMEWLDFLKNVDMYRGLAEKGDERAKRMIERLGWVVKTYEENRRKTKYDISLGIIKYSYYGDPIVLSLRFERSGDRLIAKTRILNEKIYNIEDTYRD